MDRNKTAVQIQKKIVLAKIDIETKHVAGTFNQANRQTSQIANVLRPSCEVSLRLFNLCLSIELLETDLSMKTSVGQVN
jgi:hypothetical protein